MKMIEILTAKSNNLFQSSIWAAFQSSIGRESWVVKTPEVEALVVKIPLVGGKFYLYSPRGPIFSKKAKGQDIKGFLKKITDLAKENKAVFYRIEPALTQTDIYKYGFRRVGKNAPLSLQFSPKNTLVLDLGQDEETILAGMKSKWRYNIHLAERRGVKVRMGNGQSDHKVFFSLVQELEKRGSYKGFQEEYYYKMFQALEDGGAGRLLIAEKDGEALASIFLTYFGQVGTYLHGASSNEKRDLMPSHALQWAAINQLKELGVQYYDLWGIAPDNELNHPWAGVTRFKKGFGGEEVTFPGAFDLPLNTLLYSGLTYGNYLKKVIKNAR